MRLPLILSVLLLSGCTTPSGGHVGQEPAEGALVVPSLSFAPVLDRNIDPVEWRDALLIEGDFVIADGSAANGRYPFRLHVGANASFLFLAIEVRAGPNPHSGNGPGAITYPDDLHVFLAEGTEGDITDADWQDFQNFREFGSQTLGGYWTGSEWSLQDRLSRGTLGRGGYTNDTLTWEITIPRNPTQEHDLRLAKNMAVRLCLVFARQGGSTPDARGEFNEPHDSYPGEGYTPDGHYHPHDWMRLSLT